MYIPLSTILLLHLLPTATLSSRPERRFQSLPAKVGTNNPSAQDFMQGTNQTLSAWTRSGCGNNPSGDENVWFPDLLYGKNNHALVVSFMLGRDLAPNEQLDMSFAYADGHTTDGADGVPEDWECALFQYTANPDNSNGNTLSKGTCYTPPLPVTCFNLWNNEVASSQTQYLLPSTRVGVSNNDSSSIGSSAISTSIATSTSSLTPAHPTQPGIQAACNAYAEAYSGDYCEEFAQNHSITTDQLYAWNAILGPNGVSCSNEFLAGNDSCIGVSTSIATPTPTSSSSAIPTQSGISQGCGDIVAAKQGEYCIGFAQENNITTAQLYAWNSVLGPSGQNCSSPFLAGYGYCVGVGS